MSPALPTSNPQPLDRKSAAFRAVVAIVFARILVNATRRFPYLFVPTIAKNFLVPPGSIQNIIALSNGTGLAAPLLGTIADRYGHKPAIIGTVLAMAGMSLLAALFADYGIFVLAMFTFGIAKVIYDPTVQAYLSDLVRYEQRAQVLGIAELSWALSLVIAAPVIGFILDASSLQTVFLFLAITLTISAAALWRFVQPAPALPRAYSRPSISPLRVIRTVGSNPTALAALFFTTCMALSHEMLFINYGLWMEESFGLVLTALGAVTLVIAAAEIIGELIVIALADRLGIKLTTMAGMLVAAGSFAAIPLLSGSLPLAMLGIFILFVSIETAVVASISLFSEILPQSRVLMMGTNIGANSLGRFVGAALGAFIYSTSNSSFMLIGFFSGILAVIAVIVMWRLIHIDHPAPSDAA